LWHKLAVKGWAEHVRSAWIFQTSTCYCEGVIDFDAELTDRALDLGMSEQKLDGPEIARPPIDQRRPCCKWTRAVHDVAFSFAIAVSCTPFPQL
jgi:hypothetical protein